MLSPAPFTVLFFLLGLVLGSFGNVLICRLPEAVGIGGRSACPRCAATIRIRDLLPVVSFFLLRARCRSCGERISWQYPLVEIGSGVLFVYALQRMMPSFPLALLLGYDQQLPPGVTEADLPCAVQRLPAYRPEEFKSSLLQEKERKRGR